MLVPSWTLDAAHHSVNPSVVTPPATMKYKNQEREIIFNPANGVAVILSQKESVALKEIPHKRRLVERMLSTPLEQYPQPPKRLTLVASVGGSCEHNCQYCYIPREDRLKFNICPQQIVNTIEQMSIDCNEIFVEFFGNLANADKIIQNTVSTLRNIYGEKYIRFGVQSNGRDLSVQQAITYGNLGFSIGISFDGNYCYRYRSLTSSQVTISTEILLREIITHKIPFLLRSTILNPSTTKAHKIYRQFEEMGITKVTYNFVRDSNQFQNHQPSIQPFLKFWKTILNQSLERGFPLLADNIWVKWLFRLAGVPSGWIHFCSTRWCQLYNRIHVITGNGTKDCARLWQNFSPNWESESDALYPECMICIARSICKGGCRLERDNGVHSQSCLQKQWIMKHILQNILVSPNVNPTNFGFVEMEE